MIGRDEGRGWEAGSCHELQINGRNEGNVRSCRELPIAAKRWRRWGEGDVAVSCQELQEIGRDEEREGEAAKCHELGSNGKMRGMERAATSCR